MKIISYNVNGIRAAASKGLVDWLEYENPDIFCMQEIKAMEDQFNIHCLSDLGYHVIWNPAEKKGYSGVAVLTKKEPDNIVKGMMNSRFDIEGRIIRTDFGSFSHIAVYVPSGTTGGIRQDYKMDFIKALREYIGELRKEQKEIIVSGDINICHKPIDINHPERHQDVSGFLPEERQWFDEFISDGFIDTFRVFNNEPERYSWWSYRAGSRARNIGWRIDYHLATENLRERLQNASILSHVVHSDHCPIQVELSI